MPQTTTMTTSRTTAVMSEAERQLVLTHVDALLCALRADGRLCGAHRFATWQPTTRIVTTATTTAAVATTTAATATTAAALGVVCAASSADTSPSSPTTPLAGTAYTSTTTRRRAQLQQQLHAYMPHHEHPLLSNTLTLRQQLLDAAYTSNNSSSGHRCDDDDGDIVTAYASSASSSSPLCEDDVLGVFCDVCSSSGLVSTACVCVALRALLSLVDLPCAFVTLRGVRLAIEAASHACNNGSVSVSVSAYSLASNGAAALTSRSSSRSQRDDESALLTLVLQLYAAALSHTSASLLWERVYTDVLRRMLMLALCSGSRCLRRLHQQHYGSNDAEGSARVRLQQQQHTAQTAMQRVVAALYTRVAGDTMAATATAAATTATTTGARRSGGDDTNSDGDGNDNAPLRGRQRHATASTRSCTGACMLRLISALIRGDADALDEVCCVCADTNNNNNNNNNTNAVAAGADGEAVNGTPTAPMREAAAADATAASSSSSSHARVALQTTGLLLAQHALLTLLGCCNNNSTLCEMRGASLACLVDVCPDALRRVLQDDLSRALLQTGATTDALDVLSSVLRTVHLLASCAAPLLVPQMYVFVRVLHLQPLIALGESIACLELGDGDNGSGSTSSSGRARSAGVDEGKRPRSDTSAAASSATPTPTLACHSPVTPAALPRGVFASRAYADAYSPRRGLVSATTTATAASLRHGHDSRNSSSTRIGHTYHPYASNSSTAHATTATAAQLYAMQERREVLLESLAALCRRAAFCLFCYVHYDLHWQYAPLLSHTCDVLYAIANTSYSNAQQQSEEGDDDSDADDSDADNAAGVALCAADDDKNDSTSNNSTSYNSSSSSTSRHAVTATTTTAKASCTPSLSVYAAFLHKGSDDAQQQQQQQHQQQHSAVTRMQRTAFEALARVLDAVGTYTRTTTTTTTTTTMTATTTVATTIDAAVSQKRLLMRFAAAFDEAPLRKGVAFLRAHAERVVPTSTHNTGSSGDDTDSSGRVCAMWSLLSSCTTPLRLAEPAGGREVGQCLHRLSGVLSKRTLGEFVGELGKASTTTTAAACHDRDSNDNDNDNDNNRGGGDAADVAAVVPRDVDGSVAFHKALLHGFMQCFDFVNVPLLTAIRILVYHVCLPGESQKIDRVMEAMAAHWYAQNTPPHTTTTTMTMTTVHDDNNNNNNDSSSTTTRTATTSSGRVDAVNPFRSEEGAFVLSFAIIMLNTDLHSGKMRQCMTRDEFRRMNRGIDAGHDVPPAYLDAIYDDVKRHEVLLADMLERGRVDTVTWALETRLPLHGHRRFATATTAAPAATPPCACVWCAPHEHTPSQANNNNNSSNNNNNKGSGGVRDRVCNDDDDDAVALLLARRVRRLASRRVYVTARAMLSSTAAQLSQLPAMRAATLAMAVADARVLAPNTLATFVLSLRSLGVVAAMAAQHGACATADKAVVTLLGCTALDVHDTNDGSNSSDDDDAVARATLYMCLPALLSARAALSLLLSPSSSSMPADTRAGDAGVTATTRVLYALRDAWQPLARRLLQLYVLGAFAPLRASTRNNDDDDDDDDDDVCSCGSCSDVSDDDDDDACAPPTAATARMPLHDKALWRDAQLSRRWPRRLYTTSAAMAGTTHNNGSSSSNNSDGSSTGVSPLTRTTCSRARRRHRRSCHVARMTTTTAAGAAGMTGDDDNNNTSNSSSGGGGGWLASWWNGVAGNNNSNNSSNSSNNNKNSASSAAVAAALAASRTAEARTRLRSALPDMSVLLPQLASLPRHGLATQMPTTATTNASPAPLVSLLSALAREATMQTTMARDAVVASHKMWLLCAIAGEAVATTHDDDNDDNDDEDDNGATRALLAPVLACVHANVLRVCAVLETPVRHASPKPTADASPSPPPPPVAHAATRARTSARLAIDAQAHWQRVLQRMLRAVLYIARRCCCHADGSGGGGTVMRRRRRACMQATRAVLSLLCDVATHVDRVAGQLPRTRIASAAAAFLHDWSRDMAACHGDDDDDVLLLATTCDVVQLLAAPYERNDDDSSSSHTRHTAGVVVATTDGGRVADADATRATRRRTLARLRAVLHEVTRVRAHDATTTTAAAAMASGQVERVLAAAFRLAHLRRLAECGGAVADDDADKSCRDGSAADVMAHCTSRLVAYLRSRRHRDDDDDDDSRVGDAATTTATAAAPYGDDARLRALWLLSLRSLAALVWSCCVVRDGGEALLLLQRLLLDTPSSADVRDVYDVVLFPLTRQLCMPRARAPPTSSSPLSYLSLDATLHQLQQQQQPHAHTSSLPDGDGVTTRQHVDTTADAHTRARSPLPAASSSSSSSVSSSSPRTMVESPAKSMLVSLLQSLAPPPAARSSNNNSHHSQSSERADTATAGDDTTCARTAATATVVVAGGDATALYVPVDIKCRVVNMLCKLLLQRATATTTMTTTTTTHVSTTTLSMLRELWLRVLAMLLRIHRAYDVYATTTTTMTTTSDAAAAAADEAMLVQEAVEEAVKNMMYVLSAATQHTATSPLTRLQRERAFRAAMRSQLCGFVFAAPLLAHVYADEHDNDDDDGGNNDNKGERGDAQAIETV